MEDRDPNETKPENNDTDETVGVTPAGMLAGNLTAGNTSSGIMSGMVGGGPASGVAATEVDDAEQEVSQLNLEALDTLDAYGNADRKTGDDGVSQAQSELEADEMNG
jgi:hypothetical protein